MGAARDRVRSTLQRMAVHAVNSLSSLVGDDIASRWIRRMLLRAAGATVPSSSSLHSGTYISHPRNLRMGERCFATSGWASAASSTADATWTSGNR